MNKLFKLKLSCAEHVSVLKTALRLSTFSDPDICLVSREGFKVYTHRSLLCLHSPMLSSLLCEAAGSWCCSQDGISVPVTAGSLHTLIQLLLEGTAQLCEEKLIKSVMEAATALGVDLNLVENSKEETQTFGKKAGSLELSTERTHRTEHVEFPSSKSEENLMIKSEILDDFHDIENDYSNALREPGEVFVNNFDEINQSEFEMPETPVISNAEIRAQMKIQSPEDPTHCSYECKFCKKVFVNITHLKRHLPSHTGEKPFHCEPCGLKFSRKDNLLIHKRTRCVESHKSN